MLAQTFQMEQLLANRNTNLTRQTQFKDKGNHLSPDKRRALLALTDAHSSLLSWSSWDLEMLVSLERENQITQRRTLAARQEPT